MARKTNWPAENDGAHTLAVELVLNCSPLCAKLSLRCGSAAGAGIAGRNGCTYAAVIRSRCCATAGTRIRSRRNQPEPKRLLGYGFGIKRCIDAKSDVLSAAHCWRRSKDRLRRASVSQISSYKAAGRIAAV